MLKNINEISNSPTHTSEYLSLKSKLESDYFSHIFSLVIKELDVIDCQTMLSQFVQFVDTVHEEVLKKYEHMPITVILNEIFQISNEIIINFFAGCLKFIDQKKCDLLLVLKDNLTQEKINFNSLISKNGMDSKHLSINAYNMKQNNKDLNSHIRNSIYNINGIMKSQENKIQELKLTVEDFFSIFSNISPLKHSKNNIYTIKYNEVMKMIGVINEINQDLMKNFNMLDNKYSLQMKSITNLPIKEQNFFSPKDKIIELDKIKELEKELFEITNSYKALEEDYFKVMIEKEQIEHHINDLNKEVKQFKARINEISVKNTEITNEMAKCKIEYNITKSEMNSIEQSVLNLFNKIIDIILNNMYIKLTVQKEENEMEILNETLKDKDLSRASLSNQNYHLKKVGKINLNLLLEEIHKIFEICSNKIVEIKSSSRYDKKTEKSNYEILNEISNKISEGNYSFENIFEENYKLFAKIHEEFQNTIAEEISNSAPELINSKNNCKIIDLINNYFDEVSKIFIFYEITLTNKLQSFHNNKNKSQNDLNLKRNLPTTENYAIHSIKQILGVRWCLLVPYGTDKSSMQQDMMWVKSTEIEEDKYDIVNNNSNEKENGKEVEISELKKEIEKLENNLNNYNQICNKFSSDIKEKDNFIQFLNEKMESNNNEYNTLMNILIDIINKIFNTKAIEKILFKDEVHIDCEGLKKFIEEITSYKLRLTISQTENFSIIVKKLLSDISFRDKIEQYEDYVDKKILLELNKLRNELKETIVVRDNFKTLYDQCLSMKDNKRIELISIMKIHVESLILQLSSPMNTKIKEIIYRILKLLEYSDEEIQQVFKKKEASKKGFLGLFAK